MTVRAKFKCELITDATSAYGSRREITLRPVTSGSEENKSFSQYTPYGELKMGIDQSTPAYDVFVPGKDYYIDFTPAD